MMRQLLLKYPSFSTFLILYFLSYCVSTLLYPEFRYTKYIITILYFILYFNASTLNDRNLYILSIRRFSLFYAFVFLSSFFFFWNGLDIYQCAKDITFITIPLVFSALLPKFLSAQKERFSIQPNVFLYLPFFTLIAMFLISTIGTVVGAGGIQFGLLDFLIGSNSQFETTLAFPIGFFVIVFAYYRKKNFFVYALILSIFASKRIVLLALIISALFYFLCYRKKIIKNQNLIFGLIILLNLLFVFFVIELSSGSYDNLISQYFHLSTDHLSQGRQSIYKNLLSKIDNNTLTILFGNGLGSSYVETSLFLETEANLHSDIIKLYFDLGIVGMVCWLLPVFKLCSISPLAMTLFVYLNVLYTTDNILLYYDTMIIFYVLIFTEYLFKSQNIRKKRYRVLDQKRLVDVNI